MIKMNMITNEVNNLDIKTHYVFEDIHNVEVF